MDSSCLSSTDCLQKILKHLKQMEARPSYFSVQLRDYASLTFYITCLILISIFFFYIFRVKRRIQAWLLMLPMDFDSLRRILTDLMTSSAMLQQQQQVQNTLNEVTTTSPGQYHQGQLAHGAGTSDSQPLISVRHQSLEHLPLISVEGKPSTSDQGLSKPAQCVVTMPNPDEQVKVCFINKQQINNHMCIQKALKVHGSIAVNVNQ